MRITPFSVVMIVLQVAFIILFGTTTNYVPTAGTPPDGWNYVYSDGTGSAGQYATFMHIHVMVFFGLGIMMSLVYRSSFTAAGYSLLLASTSVLWSILNASFWTQATQGSGYTFTNYFIGQPTLIQADLCAAAVLVSFGALLGRVSAVQAVLLAVWEVIVYNILVAIGLVNFVVTDIGGSVQVFFFGGLFGFVASAVLAKLSNRHGDFQLAYMTPTSATTAMLGTLFLWCFWPSFNSWAIFTTGALETIAVLNTYLALCASAIISFAVTRLLNDGNNRVQFAILATLAGGAAMGQGASMAVRPFGALLVGGFAGFVSTCSLQYLTPALRRAGFPDTIGVLSAFALPGLIGALVGIITSAAYYTSDYVLYPALPGINWPLVVAGTRSISAQAGFQAAYLALAVALALVGGVLGGLLMWFAPTVETTYNDAEEWVVESDFLANEPIKP